ncbi:NAD-dependent epimerase/dehydratase family protein [Roseateles asaccharophilus]|uniref:Nucleoside-diphosphate-sugar epimerase n=1 Tax=Roseateles asaccharophilus TaxID=582607 RepID=A0ABU2A766_9BURK|nr:NAD-dependent epimerase/dehydratase family protein [Roseateles asaccharophilus]MDR7333049.1 nucleoside-diphosphate-sugar epimerase [Roseateles asaccharophilus]
MNGKDRTALVLGASGGIGGEVARQLRDAGWTVKALQRGQRAATQRRDGIEWLRGDALTAADVARAAQGCDVIVHAVNPPGYRDWERLVLPMLDNAIAAATTQQATLVLPGTVYNFGPDAIAEPLREDAPQRPVTRKGAIRAQMEARLRAASERGMRVLIVRAGDFFGPRAGNNWFSQGLIRPGRSVKTISNPAAPGVGHQWAYLPDVARTMVELLARRDTLPAFASFHMAGHWDATGRQMAEAIQRVAARHGRTPRIAALPWWLLNLAGLFIVTFREMREMRYLWRQSVRMDNARLVAVLGREPHTPLDEAVEAALRGLGCLPATPGQRVVSAAR